MTYSVYTRKYDEVVRPLDLVDADELKALHRDMAPYRWFVTINAEDPAIPKMMQMQRPDEPVVVSILIDNSGSLRGRNIGMAVSVTTLLQDRLLTLGIPHEILGFTTKEWKGGQAREDYRNNPEAKKAAGRLCALRHIVYKEASESDFDSRHNLGLMMRYGFLKENVDGEALLWAAERLRTHEARRVMIVVSDGAPFDDSTICHNPKDGDDHILAQHLRSVIADIKDAGDIQLEAIGINFDVTKFYEGGQTVKDFEDIAGIVANKLTAILEGPQSDKEDELS